MTVSYERLDTCPRCGNSRYVQVSGRGNKKRGPMVAPRCTDKCPLPKDAIR